MQNSAISLLRTDLPSSVCFFLLLLLLLPLPPLLSETLREDLSSHKVDRFLCASPAMTTACMLLSFGGHQFYVLSLFISAGGGSRSGSLDLRGSGWRRRERRRRAKRRPLRLQKYCNLIQGKLSQSNIYTSSPI